MVAVPGVPFKVPTMVVAVPIFPFKAPTIVVAVPVLAFKAPTIVVAVLITDRPGGTPAVHAGLACTFGVAVVLSDDGVQRCQLALRPARRDACDTAHGRYRVGMGYHGFNAN